MRGRRGASRLAAAVFLAALYTAALAADFLAPYAFDEQSREHSWAPPTPLRFRDGSGRFHPRPFVYRWKPSAAGGYEEDRSRVFPVRLLVRGEEESLRLFGVDPPARLFLLGADRFGRDQLSRLLHGARISLFAGPLAALIAVAAGLAAGTAAALGRRVDDALMRLSELFLALPWLYLLFGMRAFLPLDLSPAASFLLVVAVLGAVGWAQPARLVRGAILGRRRRESVLAARGFGASGTYILRRHLLPRALGVALTQLVLLIPQYVLAEVTLSFFGLGVAEPAPSWGSLLGELESATVLLSRGWMLIPAAVLTLTVLSYHVLAEAVHELFNEADS